MRLTFEGPSIEAIFEQMATTLGERVKTPAGGQDIMAPLQTMVQERDRTINQQGLRIKELEQHLAHAVGTKDLMLIQAPTKMPDSLKEAIAIVSTKDLMIPAEDLWKDAEKDVERAKKPPARFQGNLEAGIWRLSMKEASLVDLASPMIIRKTQMPNGEYIVVIGERP